MTDCLVTGMPNVGKTCFVINFAEYMGLKELKFHVRQTAGYTSVNSYSPSEARNKLVSISENSTRIIQIIKLEIPKGKNIKELQILDSCGLSEGIHPEEDVRLAMAKTLRLIRESNCVLHMIDAAKLNMDNIERGILLPIDRLIFDYASLEKNYAILANKIDLLESEDIINILKEKLKDTIIIPLSAIYQKGFNTVKNLVLNYV